MVQSVTPFAENVQKAEKIMKNDRNIKRAKSQKNHYLKNYTNSN